MNADSLTHVRDAALLRDLAKLVRQERVSLAYVLALIGEVDARRLHVPAGFSSMHAFCVNELGFSDDAAFKRIQAARAARRFPVLFLALAEGRLHLTAVCLLAPHLTVENVHELILAATHRRQPEIEAMLARRLSLPPAPMRDRAIVRAIPPVASVPEVAVPQVDFLTAESTADSSEGGPAKGGPAGGSGDARTIRGVEEKEIGMVRPGVDDAPRSGPGPHPGDSTQPQERYLIRFTVEKRVHDKLRYAQALLSHAVPSGDVAQVIDRALEILIKEFERRKFGATLPRRDGR